ncbi:MAG: 30S ribosomal protein S7 [Anaerolineae bacterium]|nr:30S ribosomal protein S7 [Anaerolineae bacterium]
MPRRYRPSRRKVAPDARHGSTMLTRFINKVMYGGKKSVAMHAVYEALDIAAERVNHPPLEVFEEAIRNVSPLLEVKPRRVGGSTYQIPVEVTRDRQVSLAMRWILGAARRRPGKSLADSLAAEFVDAYNKTGTAIKKREDTHRMAEANRAFAHYRW